MHTSIGIPQQTCRCEALVLIPAVLTLGIDGFSVLEQSPLRTAAQLHGRIQGYHLKGGTGCIGCMEGTVEQGIKVHFQDLFIVLVIGNRVIGGIRGTGKNLTGFDLHDHNCRAFDVTSGQFLVFIRLGILRILQPVNDIGQCILCNGLQIDVDGGFHVVAGLGFLAFVVFLRNDCTVFVNGIAAQTVNAVEVAFKCCLETGLTDLGIHIVLRTFACLVGISDLFPLLVGHSAHGA